MLVKSLGCLSLWILCWTYSCQMMYSFLDVSPASRRAPDSQRVSDLPPAPKYWAVAQVVPRSALMSCVREHIVCPGNVLRNYGNVMRKCCNGIADRPVETALMNQITDGLMSFNNMFSCCSSYSERKSSGEIFVPKGRNARP